MKKFVILAASAIACLALASVAEAGPFRSRGNCAGGSCAVSAPSAGASSGSNAGRRHVLQRVRGRLFGRCR